MGEAAKLPIGSPLAVGRTAEIYAWGEGQVLKLFAAGYAEAAIEHEACVAHIVAKAGIHAPPVGDVISVAGRRGILYAKLDGVSMLGQLMRRPWRVGVLARTFGELHAAMHAVHRPQLPSQRANLQRAIHAACALTPAVRAAALDRLDRLPDGVAVCHGDYHPDNIILTQAGPVIIDWVTVGCGNPDADVARTVLLLKLGEVPNAGLALRNTIALLRHVFVKGYLRSYRMGRACPPAVVADWLPIVAAARLNENIPQETPRLVALAEQVMGGDRHA